MDNIRIWLMSVIFYLYDKYIIPYFYPLLDKIIKYIYPPLSHSLPQEDKNSKQRYVEVEHNKFSYVNEYKAKNPYVFFQLKTYLWKEFSLNQALAWPILLFPLLKSCNDTKQIEEKDVAYILEKFSFPNTVPRLNDNNAYLIKLSYSTLHKIDNDTYKENALFELFNHIPGMQGIYKRNENGLTLTQINISLDKKIYTYTTEMEEWTFARCTYINYLKIFESVTVHQLCSNFYGQRVFFALKTTLHKNHPLYKLLNPFFEGAYLTYTSFEDFGLINDKKPTNSFGISVGSNQYFELQGEDEDKVIKYLHKNSGWNKYMKYRNSIEDIKDLDIPQLSLMEKLYQLMLDTFSEIIKEIYEENKLEDDYEIQEFYKQIKTSCDLDEETLTKDFLAEIITDVAFSQSARHMQSHVNSYTLYNILDFPRRRIRTTYFLTHPKDKEGGVHTMKDLYYYLATMYIPILPLNSFDYSLNKVFAEKHLQKHLDNFVQEYRKEFLSLPRNVYTELFHRMQTSNMS